MRGSLSRFAGQMQEPQDGDALTKARQAYEETNGEIVLINRNWLTGWADQKQLELLAQKAGVAYAGKKA